MVLTYAYNLRATPKECLELNTLLGSAQKLQIVVGAIKRKNNCMQFSGVDEGISQSGDNGKLF